MKKLFVSFLSVVIGGAIVMILFFSLANENGPKFIKRGNSEHKPIEIQPKEYQCSECNMDVEALEYMAEIVREDGVTYFFDDIGCVVLWLERNKLSNPTLLSKTLDTKEWVDATKAWYTRVASSPMGYGFGAYKNKAEGLIEYQEMRILMLQGKNLHDPFVKKSLLEQLPKK